MIACKVGRATYQTNPLQDNGGACKAHFWLCENRLETQSKKTSTIPEQRVQTNTYEGVSFNLFIHPLVTSLAKSQEGVNTCCFQASNVVVFYLRSTSPQGGLQIPPYLDGIQSVGQKNINLVFYSCLKSSIVQKRTIQLGIGV